jgi:aminoglycoside N3'-acetyltransferase
MNPKSESTPLSQIEMEAGLRNIGLAFGTAVEVHSSLRSFGLVSGGAATIVNALMNVVGEESAIIMPAYPLSKPMPLSEAEKGKGIVAKVEIFAEDHEGESGMGRIADEFRHRPGVKMGQGMHRVCAWGKNAEKHIRGYDYLLEIDGSVLLLGVGIDRCSCMHQAEIYGLPREVTDCYRVPDSIQQQYPANIYVSYGKTPEDGWAKIQEIATRRGLIGEQTIGQALCMFFKAKPVVDIYTAALQSDPLGLFGIKK